MVLSATLDDTDALRTSFSRCGRCTRPLTGPLTTVLLRSLLSGDRLPPSVVTISPPSTDSEDSPRSALTGAGVMGACVGSWGSFNRSRRLACSLETATFSTSSLRGGVHGRRRKGLIADVMYREKSTRKLSSRVGSSGQSTRSAVSLSVSCRRGSPRCVISSTKCTPSNSG